MGIVTLFRFLVGDRGAILQLASTPWTLVVGFVFVLSAGFAREYDAEDLLHKPWHLLLPLGASLAASLVLFCFLKPSTADSDPSFFSGYLSFLGLFWMTAPLAWLYAIPYERFLGSDESMQANLGTLGLVAAWRVILMMRILFVLFGYTVVEAFCLVMAFADALALPALIFVPQQILSGMSGIQQSNREALLAGVGFQVGLAAGCTSPIWFVLGVGHWLMSEPHWQAVPLSNRSRPGWALWALAGASVAIWAVILPFTQPVQRHSTLSGMASSTVSSFP
jgi:hypothetical protein